MDSDELRRGLTGTPDRVDADKSVSGGKLMRCTGSEFAAVTSDTRAKVWAMVRRDEEEAERPLGRKAANLRMSGKVWEQKRQRLYFLHRWPSQRAMGRIRQRVNELTPRSRCHDDIRNIIESLNPVLRGWAGYLALQPARWLRLATARVPAPQAQGLAAEARRGRALDARRFPQPRTHPPARLGEVSRVSLALGGCAVPRLEKPPVSRVQEIRTHGLKGGLALLLSAPKALEG